MDDQNQTVADAGDTPAEAAPSAAPDLDTLLKDWSEPDEKQPQSTVTQPQNVVAQSDVSGLLKGLQPLVKYAEFSMNKDKANVEKQVTDEAVALVKSDDALKEVDDEFIHDHLIGKYNRDTGFRAAYDNLGSDPAGWKKALGDTQSGLVEKIGALPGSTLRSDMEAAQAAVNGSLPEPAPEPEVSALDMANMSDRDFKVHKMGLLAKS